MYTIIITLQNTVQARSVVIGDGFGRLRFFCWWGRINALPWE
jgi:hypothetical protein